MWPVPEREQMGAAAVASHLVKVEPENAGWWIKSRLFSQADRECREGRKPFCCERKRFNPKEAMIAFNIACYASIMGLIEEAHERLRHAIELDKNIRLLALDDEDLRPFVGLDRWLGIVGRALSSNGIPRRAGGETRGMSKRPDCSLFTRKSLNLVEVSRRGCPCLKIGAPSVHRPRGTPMVIATL